MGEGALTKQQLDELTAEWNAWRKELDAPVPAAKSVTTPKVKHAALIQAIIKGIAPTIYELEKQITALQTRVTELESNALKYCGVWQPSAAYQRGNVITYDGSAWHATRAVAAERPGTSDGWQLMVKHGKDAASPRSDATATASPRENGHYAKPRSP